MRPVTTDLLSPIAIVTLALSLAAGTGCAGDASNDAQTDAPTADDLAALAPRAGYGIFETDGCALLAGDGLDAPVPVASVFKLWVLDAVARSVDAGDITWDTPVTIQDSLRSDPSGEAYGYAAGRQVPVRQLAELMIAVSDNTATDHLIDLVGREPVEDVIRDLASDGAARTLPLLTTADMARLKFVHPDLGRDYVDLAPDARRAFLAALPERAPFPWPDDPAAISRLDLNTPSLVDEIEWFASGADVCRTMADLSRLARQPELQQLAEILSANHGLPPDGAKAWNTTWFKGGSEPGVVALAYRLATTDVDRVIVIALSDPDQTLTQRPDGRQVIESILSSAADAGLRGGR